MAGKTTRYTLPATFWHDHVARDLPGGTKVSENRSTVTVDLDRDDYDEILSDAKHYAEAMSRGGYDDGSMIRSARRTVARLEAAPFAAPFDVMHEGEVAERDPNYGDDGIQERDLDARP